MNKLGWLFAATALIAGAAHAEDRKTPYWASIATNFALMRTGPARTYPPTWLYRRHDLPIRVLQVYGDWRRVREQDGTEGWMLSTLLSAKRTAVVTGDAPAPMHADPDTGSALSWRAEPGVVGKISKCDDGWCLFDVAGKRGYVRIERIWGVDVGETVE